ncbi:MAG: AMP-binding protein [Chloroflexi bacterium]|nr:AMP-binding protein [Chloroflexota bacterium]
MTFLHTLIDNLQQLGNKTAVEFVTEQDVETITYAMLNEAVERSMVYLQQLGVQPGDRVAMQLPKCLPFLYLHLAVLRLGAISLPLNTAYPPQRLSYFLEDAGASLFFAESKQRDTLVSMLLKLPDLKQTIFLELGTAVSFTTSLPTVTEPLPAPPDDIDAIALMIYTSGTTGRPKGAMITHGNLTTNINGLHTAWGWQPDDVLMHVLPIFHVHGLIVALHGALNAGATAVLLAKFNEQHTLELMEKRKCTVFMAVPTIHRRLLAFPGADSYDLGSMRLMTSGSDRLPDDLFLKAQKIYGHTLLERYGMTETGMNLSNPLHGERRVGAVGLPLPGVSARIVNPESDTPLPDGEIGEVQVRGTHVCKGYWRQPEKTAASFTADGWFRTGDLGLREPDGYFTLKGRSKDLIISGGYNIYPPEVELVLADHPGIAASAVIGCPDEQWGERVTAVIIPKRNHPITESDIIDHCRQQLANYKVPKQIIFVDAFPANALGKVQKAKLRAAICA